MKTYGERIKYLFDKHCVTPYFVSQQTNVSQATISRLLNDSTAKASIKTNKLLADYFNVDERWLLTGQGSMFVEEEAAAEPGISYTTGRPYYNVDFIGGFDMVLNDQTSLPEYNIDFEPYNKEGVMWCNITGHSMEPSISHGDIIAIKEVRDWQSYLNYGEVYAIVTMNDMRTVKVVRKGTKEDTLRLVPSNTDEYDEQEIPKRMVMRVFEVIGCMKRI